MAVDVIAGADGVQYAACSPTEFLVQGDAAAPTYYQVTLLATLGALVLSETTHLLPPTVQTEVDAVFSELPAWTDNALVAVSPEPQVPGGRFDSGVAVVLLVATVADKGLQVGELPGVFEDHTRLRVNRIQRLTYSQAAAYASGAAVDAAQADAQAQADSSSPGGLLDGLLSKVQTFLIVAAVIVAAVWFLRGRNE